MKILCSLLSAAVLAACAGPRNRLPILLKALKSDKPEVRAEAARGLGELGPEAAGSSVPALAEALRDRQPAVSRAASDALVKLGAAARGPLAALAVEPAAWLRCRALETLGRLDPSADDIPLFTRALSDHDQCVHMKAVEALAKIGGPAVPPLVRTLKSPNPAVRRRASDALSRMPADVQERAVFPLIQELRSKDEYQRGEAEILLSEMGRPAVPSLVALLDDPDPDIRRRVVVTLGRVGVVEPDVLQGLLARLSDKDRIVRLKASLALGELGERDPGMLSHLMARVGGGDVQTRRGVVAALGNMGPVAKDAVPTLISLLSDEDKDVREEASEALMKIGTFEAMDAAERHNRKNLK